MRQRGLLLTCGHALRWAAKTATRQLFKDSGREAATFTTLCQQPFAGVADAHQALDACCQRWKVIRSEEAAIQPLSRHRCRGRPASMLLN